MKNGLIAAFSILLALSCLGVLFIILMLVCKIEYLKVTIYVLWIIVGWYTVIGFLVASVTFTASIITEEACSIVS
jgi:hypothetical protein